MEAHPLFVLRQKSVRAHVRATRCPLSSAAAVRQNACVLFGCACPFKSVCVCVCLSLDMALTSRPPPVPSPPPPCARVHTLTPSHLQLYMCPPGGHPIPPRLCVFIEQTLNTPTQTPKPPNAHPLTDIACARWGGGLRFVSFTRGTSRHVFIPPPPLPLIRPGADRLTLVRGHARPGTGVPLSSQHAARRPSVRHPFHLDTLPAVVWGL